MNRETIIINSGPLIALAGIGRLELLPNLFHNVLVPKAVYQEVTQVLIDEMKGRKVARLYSLQVFGTARLLVEAKRSKLLDDVDIAL